MKLGFIYLNAGIMQKLSAILLFISVFVLTSGTAFAIGYCIDAAPTSPHDKTFDDEWTGIVGEEIEIDVYLNDVPESIFTAGVFMLPYQYPGEEVTDIQIFDGFYGPPGPWTPQFSIPCWNFCAGLPPYPVSFIVGNVDGAQPDEDGDIIICTIRLRFLQEGEYSIVFSTLPDFDTVIGYDTSMVYDSQIVSKEITIRQVSSTTSIPTLSEWGIIILMTLIFGISVIMLLRKRAV